MELVKLGNIMQSIRTNKKNKKIMKICTKCYIKKNIDKFSIDKSRKDNYCYCCKKCLGKVGKIYYQKNRTEIQKKHKKYYEKNLDKIKEQRKKQRKNNKKEINKYARERRKNNINIKILANLRSRVNIALKNNMKSIKTEKLIGCTIIQLKQHLQNQFKKGMNWSNYGLYGWHIDHKIPCASFDLSKENKQQKCFNYKNLQPLWAKENLKKGIGNG